MKLRKKYKGVSLVEMLLAMVVIAAVMILSSVTLVTMIRASTVSAQRTMAREESEFILEFMRRSIRNSDENDIDIYTVTGRVFNSETDLVEDLEEVGGFESSNDEGVVGNEVHFRPSGFQRWICIGFFVDSDDDAKGYILKSSMNSNENPQDCFDSSKSEYLKNTLVLNSNDIDVNYFNIDYYRTLGENLLITVELDVEPVHWLVMSETGLKPNYYKRTVVSTQKLTWEK